MADRGLMNVTRHKSCPCLNCGKLVDSATRVEGGGLPPQPGDVTICLDCRHLMAYADDMSLRELTGEEIVEVAGDPVVVKAMNVLASFDRWKADERRPADRRGVRNLRVDALEKRVTKLEDVVSEILRRTAGFGKLVQASDRAADGEQLPSDRDAEGGAVETSGSVSLPPRR
jgi:hypothetical protein